MTVHVVEDGGQWESKAATDLQHYLGRMLDRDITLSHLAPKASSELQFVVGSMALKLRPKLEQKLKATVKKDWLLRNDAVISELEGSTVYLAGSNDDSHYYAVSRFLHQQGCRWYLPTEIGECIPSQGQLNLQEINSAYAPPLEIRNYWIAWNGDRTDYETFAHRNFFHNQQALVGSHELGNLLQEAEWAKTLALHPPGTISQVADLLQAKHAEGKNISLGISDAVQRLQDPTDLQVSGGFQDKFFAKQAVADAYIPFYNKVIAELKKRNPQSPSLFSFLAYTNLTLPPQRQVIADDSLVAFLAPIDIDPNHHLLDARSPSKLDLWGALQRWNQVMEGRVIIYDYDQGMLVWRDLPNPSHHVVAEDVKRYRDLGILGVSTESRNALATTFTNLHFRGQLYWNPDLDLDRELKLFYQNFYGELASPFEAYWQAIYQAWQETDVVDHEFFVAREIYTPELVSRLETFLETVRSKEIKDPVQARRRDFTLKSFELLKAYSQMVEAADSQADYLAAAKHGTRALEIREQLSDLHPAFTTHRQFKESGPAWWPGEVEYFRQLAKLEQVVKAPLEWHFKVDSKDSGIWRNWAQSTDFSDWKQLRIDALPRHLGILEADHTSPEGYAWYACQIELSPKQIGKGDLQLVFPGLFNNSWLYLNGHLVDWRSQQDLWWNNDYRFLWTVDLEGKLKPGLNTIALRTKLKQHPSGLFRRPFLARKP